MYLGQTYPPPLIEPSATAGQLDMWKNVDVPMALLQQVNLTCGRMQTCPIGNLTYFALAYKTHLSCKTKRTNTPQKHRSRFNRQVMQITYAALYGHLALLFSDSSQLCIYMTSIHILTPNVCKSYQDYFQSTPIDSYPSMSSIVYYYTKVLLSRNYFYWSFTEKEHNYIRSPWHLHSSFRSAWYLRMQIYILQNAIEKAVDIRHDLLNIEEFM